MYVVCKWQFRWLQVTFKEIQVTIAVCSRIYISAHCLRECTEVITRSVTLPLHITCVLLGVSLANTLINNTQHILLKIVTRLNYVQKKKILQQHYF